MDYLKLLGKKSITNAPIWKRILAFIIDLFIINLFIFFPFNNILKNMLPENISFKESYRFFVDSEIGKVITIISLIISLLALLYFVILEYKIGQTAGKILLNIYVISETGKLSIWQCIARSLFLIPIFPLILLWIIDPLYLIFIGKNKRLSEVLSKTKVIEKIYR